MQTAPTQAAPPALLTAPLSQDVSKQLARISREGRRCERGGDCFKSGDLAFQIQDIIQATGDLLKRSQCGLS